MFSSIKRPFLWTPSGLLLKKKQNILNTMFYTFALISTSKTLHLHEVTSKAWRQKTSVAHYDALYVS